MRMMYYPSRPPIDCIDTDKRTMMVKNPFPELFAEVFQMAGWQIVAEGTGDWNIPEQNLCDIRSWMFNDIRLGVFHWQWDIRPEFEQLIGWLKGENRKLLWVAHEIGVLDLSEPGLRKTNRKLMLENADYIVCLNEKDRKFAQANSHAKVLRIEHFMPNTLVGKYEDIPFYRNNSRLFGPFRIEEKTFCFYGRVVDHKGIVEAVEAWESIRHKYPEWKFKIYGVATADSVDVVRELRQHLGPQTVWVEEGFQFLPDQLGEFAFLPYKECNNSGMIEELIAYESPVVGTDILPFSGKTSMSGNIQELPKLLECAINDIGGIRSKARELKVELIRQNARARSELMQIASEILTEVYLSEVP